jgi:hypothetical protein
LIAAVDNGDRSDVQRATRDSKFILAKDSPDGNEMWRKIIAPEIDGAEQIAAEIH